jgi:NADPH-dependent 2,4-dienoyl-CoA reductase/sulfur reductase-like enzyme
VHTRHRVVAIMPREQQVVVDDLDGGGERRESYDRLLIACGALPVRPALEGIDSDGIHQVNSFGGGLRLRELLDRQSPQRVVVVGGGYIGVEMAEALHQRGLPVTLVQRPAQLMSTLDAEMAEAFAEYLTRAGVTLRLGEAVQGFTSQNGRVSGVVTDQGTIAGDLVILGLGVTPNSALARAAGIPLGVRESIRVNQRQETETANIWAAGDCAESHHLISGRAVHLALGTVANKQGRVAGINLADGEASFPGVLGTAITKFMEGECSRSGLSERELQELGWEYVTATVDGHTLPRYYPGSAPIRVKVLAAKGTGRLLGVQIVGGPGSAKRIDTAAVALQAGLTLEELLYLDLSYAPPFSGVWDPLVIAARLALKET